MGNQMPKAAYKHEKNPYAKTIGLSNTTSNLATPIDLKINKKIT